MARRTVVIGDSLGVGTLPYLQRVLGGQVRGNVKVGRSSADGVNALSSLLRGGADRIIMDLGTNDAGPQQLRQSVQRARQLAGGRDIFIPTVNGPNAAAKNAELRRLAGGNVHLVNWANQSHGLTGPDGIHSTGAGYQRRAQIVAHSIGAHEQGGSPMALNNLGRGVLGRNIHPDDITTLLAAQNKTAGVPGSLATPRALTGPQGGAAYLLSQGVSNRSLPGQSAQVQTPYRRYAVNRGGRMLEAHDYGNGDIRYFARKNPAILQAAVQQSLGNRATPQMSPQDEELLKLLLGNPTLSR